MVYLIIAVVVVVVGGAFLTDPSTWSTPWDELDRRAQDGERF